MTTQEPQEPGLAQKILALSNQLNGLRVTLNGNRDDIMKFWQIIQDIKQLCQEESKAESTKEQLTKSEFQLLRSIIGDEICKYYALYLPETIKRMQQLQEKLKRIEDAQ